VPQLGGASGRGQARRYNTATEEGRRQVQEHQHVNHKMALLWAELLKQYRLPDIYVGDGTRHLEEARQRQREANERLRDDLRNRAANGAR
jgi:hypothetical protein